MQELAREGLSWERKLVPAGSLLVCVSRWGWMNLSVPSLPSLSVCIVWKMWLRKSIGGNEGNGSGHKTSCFRCNGFVFRGMVMHISVGFGPAIFWGECSGSFNPWLFLRFLLLLMASQGLSHHFLLPTFPFLWFYFHFYMFFSLLILKWVQKRNFRLSSLII